jgi:serine phosphatase RsbU (regulator of sigma subunit)
MMVTRATQQELDALAARRLELLMDGASELYRATNEQELSSAIADLALAGTGFHRAVVLRHAAVEPEVLCSREPAMRPAAGGFSRSMVKEAASGHAVRLSRGDVPPSQHSICTLGIHSALCCPILLDGSVVGYIYLDSRGTEQPCYPDAVGFGHAVARLAGLCLANLKRGDLQIRQKQLENELRAAREVQTFLGPPAESRIGHVRYVARTHPGRFVAGDLFDIFPLDGDRVAVCFGDVCGQGMGAAILMAAILSHLRAAIAMGGDLVAAVGNINRYLVDHQSLETFATLFVAVLDQRLGVLQYVDAGHGHWMVKRADGSLTETPLPGSIVIGVERDFPYRQASLPVAAGDRLVIYSDGVVEQVTPDGEEFGRSRLLQIVATSPDSAADVALSFEALKTFLGSAGLEDDTTLVSITLES